MLRRDVYRLASCALTVLQQAVQQQQCGWLSRCQDHSSRFPLSYCANQLQEHCNQPLKWPSRSICTTSSAGAAVAAAATEGGAGAAAAAEAGAAGAAAAGMAHAAEQGTSNSIDSSTNSSRRREGKRRRSAGATAAEVEATDREAANTMYSSLQDAGLNTQQLLKFVQGYPGAPLSPADYCSSIKSAMALQPELPHLNMADLLARQPTILQTYNPEGLVAQLRHAQQLLQQQGGLSEDEAVRWLGQCRALDKTLHRMEDVVQLILEKCRVYEDVLGHAPSPSLFWRSSHRSRTPAEDLRPRLQHLLKLFGDADHLHKALEQNSSLLNSSPGTVEANLLQHRKNLQLTEEEMRKVAVDWPRCAVMRPELLLERAQQLQQMLKLPDLAAIKPLLLAYPRAFGNKGASMGTKLAELQALFGLNGQDLATLVMQQPSLCGSATATVKARADNIQQLLGLTEQQMHRMLAANRAAPVLTLSITTLEQRIPELIKVLGCTKDKAAQLFVRMPTLLCYPPATMERNIQQLATAAGLSTAEALHVLRSDPVVLQLNPGRVVACMQRMRGLIAQHPPWAGPTGWDSGQVGLHVLRLATRVGPRTADRMEFLLYTGRPTEAGLHKLRCISNAVWDDMYPEYRAWLQARQETQEQLS